MPVILKMSIGKKQIPNTRFYSEFLIFFDLFHKPKFRNQPTNKVYSRPFFKHSIVKLAPK